MERPGPITIINADTGLLNTPVIEQTMLRFEMLFEPSLDVGSLVSVISLTYPQINGLYNVVGVHHQGIISPVVSGTLITTVELFYNTLPTPVVAV